MAETALGGSLKRSFGLLRGNTRACVIMQPMWGIPFTLYNFYLSLYMKALGVTDRQIGLLISMGYVIGFITALFAGLIVDALGRRKSTLIFDFLAWPAMIAIFAASHEFWHFALAMALGNAALRVAGVSWTLILVEDAEGEERVAGYNYINTINIFVGVLTPLAGYLVRRLGIIAGERVLMIFAVVSMTAMVLIRHRMLRETKIGLEILADRAQYGGASKGIAVFYGRTIGALRERPRARWVLLAVILYNTFFTFGSYNSLYYAPYLTEALQLDRAVISLLGGINSAVLILVLALLIPALKPGRRWSAMFRGLSFQAASLFMFIIIPRRSLLWAAGCVVIFAYGFGLFKAFIDPLLAEVTEGKARAGLYSLMSMATMSLCTVLGLISGDLYHFRPALLYLVCLGILLASMACLRWGLTAGEPAAQVTPDPSADPQSPPPA